MPSVSFKFLIGESAFTYQNRSCAPVVSALAGVVIALGVVSAHFAPHWSALSDPYSGLDLGALSWVAAGAEAAAAAGLAIVAIGALRGRQRQPAAGTL